MHFLFFEKCISAAAAARTLLLIYSCFNYIFSIFPKKDTEIPIKCAKVKLKTYLEKPLPLVSNDRHIETASIEFHFWKQYWAYLALNDELVIFRHTIVTRTLAKLDMVIKAAVTERSAPVKLVVVVIIRRPRVWPPSISVSDKASPHADAPIIMFTDMTDVRICKGRASFDPWPGAWPWPRPRTQSIKANGIWGQSLDMVTFHDLMTLTMIHGVDEHVFGHLKGRRG